MNSSTIYDKMENVSVENHAFYIKGEWGVANGKANFSKQHEPAIWPWDPIFEIQSGPSSKCVLHQTQTKHAKLVYDSVWEDVLCSKNFRINLAWGFFAVILGLSEWCKSVTTKPLHSAWFFFAFFRLNGTVCRSTAATYLWPPGSSQLLDVSIIYIYTPGSHSTLSTGESCSSHYNGKLRHSSWWSIVAWSKSLSVVERCKFKY